MRSFTVAILLLLVAVFSCSPTVPEKWKLLGIPSQGLVKVYSHSDANGFYGDYTGTSAEELSNRIAGRLKELGFTEVCSQFEGIVKGFQKQDQKYIVKVAELGGRVGLSIFDENGEEPILYGICFKGYTLGEPVRIK